jgi:hypothetical protein
MPCGGIREGSARELCVREANLSHSRRLVHSMWCSCDRDPSELNGYRYMIARGPRNGLDSEKLVTLESLPRN